MKQIETVLAQFKTRWKTFFISFLAGLLMTTLPHLGLRPQSFFQQKPLVTSDLKISPDNQVLNSKLNLKTPYNFKLSKKSSIIPQTLAKSDFEALKSYSIVDLDSGEIISSKNISQAVPIASITKIMTAVVSLDLLNPDQEVTIKKADTIVIPTKMGLIEGQQWKVSELLNAMLLTSANDAAEALKNEVDLQYGEGSFVSSMNTKAKLLNLKNTHYQNPQGFDGNSHFSSSEDLTLLTKYALDNFPLISSIVQKDYQFYPETETHKQADLYNWNGLLGVYPGTRGVKIGNTEDAGYTTIVLSERQGKRILVVSLGAPGVLERDLWASELLDLGFADELNLKPVGITEEQLKAKYKSWKYFN